MKYDFAAIEKKWQEKWEQEKPYAAVTGDSRPKFYGLIEFPYPSAAGLHVGHPRPFTAMDIICRKKRMQDYNVLNPIGFDAFGLPTENFAIKNHIHPAIVTKRNIENFTRQLKMLGYSFDWERVIDTTDPGLLRWTQWIFLQMYKHGLAYKTTMPVNWCTSCKCVLANEEVVEGVCERCGAPVVRKEKSQWMLRITKYADRLIDDLDGLDYIERVKTQQRNWIGRSTGTEVTFKTNTEDDITVYTTRVDTLFGVTYTVISPSIRCSTSGRTRSPTGPTSRLTKRQLPASPTLNAANSTRTRPASALRASRSRILRPARSCRCSFRIMFLWVTARALSWAFQATISATGTSQRSLVCLSSRSFRAATLPRVRLTLKDDTGIMVNSGFLNGMTVKEAIPCHEAVRRRAGLGP